MGELTASDMKNLQFLEKLKEQTDASGENKLYDFMTNQMSPSEGKNFMKALQHLQHDEAKDPSLKQKFGNLDLSGNNLTWHGRDGHAYTATLGENAAAQRQKDQSQISGDGTPDNPYTNPQEKPAPTNIKPRTEESDDKRFKELDAYVKDQRNKHNLSESQIDENVRKSLGVDKLPDDVKDRIHKDIAGKSHASTPSPESHDSPHAAQLKQEAQAEKKVSEEFKTWTQDLLKLGWKPGDVFKYWSEKSSGVHPVWYRDYCYKAAGQDPPSDK